MARRYQLNAEERKLLRRIRALITKTHWTKGAYCVTDGSGKECYCLVGLVNHVTGADRYEAGPYDLGLAALALDAERGGARDRLLAALGTAIRRRYRSVAGIEQWNDRKGRTREDVLSVVDEALASRVTA
jgi:hypothetical protein